MRRAAAWGCTAALIAALALCGFARWPVSPSKVRDGLNANTGASLGLRWRVPSSASFSSLPWPSLRIAGASLEDAHGASLVDAPDARLDLSLPRLLLGRFVPERAVLTNPTLTLDFDRPPFKREEGESAGSNLTAALAPLKSLSLSNGLLRVVSKRRGFDALVLNLNGRLDGLADGGRLSLDLRGIWRDAPIEMAGVLGDSGASLKGAASPLELAIAAPMAKLALNGLLAAGETPNFEGEATAAVSSIAALADLFGWRQLPGLSSDDLSIVGNVKVSPRSLTFDGAKLTIAQQTFEGALEITGIDKRPAISGTLAADRVALRPFLDPFQPLVDSTGRWSGQAFALPISSDFDLDLRLSAGRLDVYGHEISNAAASVIVRHGKLSANLIEAAAFGGRLSGETTLECARETLLLHARAELADADLGAAFNDFGRPIVTGHGGARFAIEAFGDSPASAIAHLNGSAALTAADGAIAVINLEEALRRSQRRQIDVERDLRPGDTAFDKLEASVTLDNGRARIERGEMTSRGVAARLAGSIDLAGQAWDLTVDAVQTGAAGEESQDAAHLTLDIQGPWSGPTVRAPGKGDQPPPDSGPAEAPASP